MPMSNKSMTVNVLNLNNDVVGTLVIDVIDSSDDTETAAAVAWQFFTTNAKYQVEGETFAAADLADWWA